MQKQPFKFEVGEEVINRLGHKCVIRDRKVNKYGANIYLVIIKVTLTIDAWLPEREFYPLSVKQYVNAVYARCAICGVDDNDVHDEIIADTIEEAKVILSEDYGWKETDGHWICGSCAEHYKENAKERVLEQQNINPVVNFRQVIRTHCMSCFTHENFSVDKTEEEIQAILLNYNNGWGRTKDGLVCDDCID